MGFSIQDEIDDTKRRQSGSFHSRCRTAAQSVVIGHGIIQALHTIQKNDPFVVKQFFGKIRESHRISHQFLVNLLKKLLVLVPAEVYYDVPPAAVNLDQMEKSYMLQLEEAVNEVGRDHYQILRQFKKNQETECVSIETYLRALMLEFVWGAANRFR